MIVSVLEGAVKFNVESGEIEPLAKVPVLYDSSVNKVNN